MKKINSIESYITAIMEMKREKEKMALIHHSGFFEDKKIWHGLLHLMCLEMAA